MRIETKRHGAVVVWLVPLIAILGLASYLWMAPGPRRPVAAGENPDANSAHRESDEAAGADSDVPPTVTGENQSTGTVEQQLEGDWTSYYQGQRQMTVRADGTCTMIAEPEGLASALLAAKLTFEIQWKMNGEHMEFETTGGEPLDKVNIVVRMYGKKRSHKILRLAPNDLVLLDEDGVTKYEWHRVAK